MFGPPCTDSLPYLEEAIYQFPDILESFHSFHLQDAYIQNFYSFVGRDFLQHCLKTQVC